MKYKVKDFAKKFRSLVGDTNIDIPDEFILTSLNWAFNALPGVPGLQKGFSKHYTSQLDANNHFRWNLNEDFRCIADLPVLNFYTTTGGDPCPLKLCFQDNFTFYKLNGLVELKKKGTPCHYTLEREGDKTWLVIDRPSDVPIILDYIVCGYPKNVESMEDDIAVDLSSIMENLILNTMREVFYTEAEDLAFAGLQLDTASNKYIPEAVQMLNKRMSSSSFSILGEVTS